METPRYPFTKAEVDYLVGEQKFIKEIPSTVKSENFLVLRAEVFTKENDPLVPVKGRVFVMSRVAISVSGVPAAIPSATLWWHGRRIRGIDKETRHDNPDGDTIYGWHSHIWSPEYEDACVVQAKEPKRKDLRGLFMAGLEKWNISVVKEQMEV